MNDLSVLAPSGITVVFPAAGTSQPSSGFYAIGVPLGSLQLVQYRNVVGAPWNHTINRYESATFSGGNSGTPVNAAALQSLATQLATDWYLWRLGRLEQQYVGALGDDPGAFHDREWSQGPSTIKTRVMVKGEHREDLISPSIAKGSDCAIRDQTTCIAGREVRRISYDCGATWTIVEDLGRSCGPGSECQTIFPPIETSLPGPCIGGLDYAYYQTLQFYFDARGCLQISTSPQILRATGKCCSFCGSGSSGVINTGTGGICPGLPCAYCKTSTPCQFTFSLTCPDFGGSSGSGQTNNCTNCTSGTPETWGFAGSGFTGDFDPFNVSISLAWALEDFANRSCYWYYFGGIGTVSGQVLVFSDGATITVDLQLLAPDAVTWIEYSGTFAAAGFDCCIARVLSFVQAQGGADGIYPSTVTVTPSCGTTVACTPNPSGSWTLTQSPIKTCVWVQYKSGVTSVLSLFYDAITGTFEWELVITGADYTFVFLYVSAPGKTTIPCDEAYALALVFQDGCECSDGPLEITLTPLASALACCNPVGSGGTGGSGGSGGSGGGSGGAGTVMCAGCATPIPATLYVRFTGALAAYGCFSITYNSSMALWSANFPVNACSTGGIFSLACLANGTFSLSGGATENPTGLIATCGPPFSLSHNGTANVGSSCPGAAYGVTISEVPC